MRLVDFLILVLQAHGKTLEKLGVLFGDDVFLELLESSSDELHQEPPRVLPIWAPGSSRANKPSASVYAELEGAVRDLKLPAVLEFHLWAYPYYRAFIESPLDLNSHLQGGENQAHSLVDEAIAHSETWLKSLKLPPEFATHVERVAQPQWIKFRATVLKRVGKRPMGPVL